MKVEPVAYINVESRKLEWAKTIEWHTPTVVNLEPVPLYTQREWVGLTDDERMALFETAGGLNDYAKAIESKLKQKNT